MGAVDEALEERWEREKKANVSTSNDKFCRMFELESAGEAKYRLYRIGAAIRDGNLFE